MIVDTDGSTCVTVNFAIGGGSDTRNWDIMVSTFINESIFQQSK